MNQITIGLHNVNSTNSNPRLRLRPFQSWAWRSTLLLGWILCACTSLTAESAPPQWLAIKDVKVYTLSKQGVIEKGTVLIRDGKIAEVGEQVKVPVTASVLDGRGKSLLPGFLSVFHPITLQQPTDEGETRTVVVRGRAIPVPGRSPSSNTSFVKVADAFPADAIDWRRPLRSGITTMHVAVPGYCQTLVIKPGDDPFTSVPLDAKHGQLLITLTNNSQSLDVLRNGLRPSERPPGPTGSPASAPGGRRGPGGPPGRESPPAVPPSGTPAAARPAGETSNAPPPEPTLEQKLWNEVREGKSTLWINVNNAATILHALKVLKDHPKVKVAWIANGGDVFETIEDFPKSTTQLVLSPRIDTVPNSRLRMNVPALASKAKLPFVLSLGARTAELIESQAAPTFALAMLVKTGLGEEEALRSITLGPAQSLGLEDQLGSIEPGKIANLVLFDGSPFEAATSISEVFLEGSPVNEK